jgi:hypothetical protein
MSQHVDSVYVEEATLAVEDEDDLKVDLWATSNADLGSLVVVQTADHFLLEEKTTLNQLTTSLLLLSISIDDV